MNVFHLLEDESSPCCVRVGIVSVGEKDRALLASGCNGMSIKVLN